MALAVLKTQARVQVQADSRLLRASQWQALQASAELREALMQESAQAIDAAVAETTARLRAKAAGNERIVQQALLLKAIHLQREFDAAQQRWHALFVDSLTTALQAVLGDPLPPQFFAQVRRSAAQFVGDRQQAVLHVAAADEPAVRDALGESRQGQGMAWQVNPTLAAGQCFLDTPFGRVQASLATQLERLRDALSAWWAEQPPITTTAPWATTPPP